MVLSLMAAILSSARRSSMGYSWDASAGTPSAIRAASSVASTRSGRMRVPGKSLVFQKSAQVRGGRSPKAFLS
ncbi:Uncharacterised protein [Bordetella pertussis]|nr:Uncharacterised protein [Bordetella pertussis]